MLAPLLFNIYTNDQSRSEGTCPFIYADDLALAAQDREFGILKKDCPTLLMNLHLTMKRQVCAFHLWSREANHKLNVSWSGILLENCNHPVYLGVILDRCLSLKTHVEKPKIKSVLGITLLASSLVQDGVLTQ